VEAPGPVPSAHCTWRLVAPLDVYIAALTERTGSKYERNIPCHTLERESIFVSMPIYCILIYAAPPKMDL
jgi:hypothetical protein